MCPHPHVPSGKTEFGTSGTAGQGGVPPAIILQQEKALYSSQTLSHKQSTESRCFTLK